MDDSTRRSVPSGNNARCLGVIELPLHRPASSSIWLRTRRALMNLDWLYGLIHLGFWSYVWITLAMVQTTMMVVTVYLHRDATHRILDLVHLEHADVRMGGRASQAPRLRGHRRRSAQPGHCGVATHSARRR